MYFPIAMNILIANHTGTQAHLGCRATTYALEQMLRQKLRPDNIWTDSWDARRLLRKTKSLLPLVTSLGIYSVFKLNTNLKAACAVLVYLLFCSIIPTHKCTRVSNALNVLVNFGLSLSAKYRRQYMNMYLLRAPLK